MCPEIPAAARVLLNHAVVALAFVWVMVIIAVCGVGFYYLFFLNVKLTVKLALVGQRAWCGFYLPRTWGRRRRGKWLDQFAAVRVTVPEFKVKDTAVRYPNPPGL